MEDRRKCKTQNRRQKSNKEKGRRTFLSLMCVSCIGYASREKLALSLHIKGLSF